IDSFFFQAEDGIRDRTVTGVQTCALPIWDPAGEVARRALPGHHVQATAAVGQHDVRLAVAVEIGRGDRRRVVRRGYAAGTVVRRSEERRVGKEWRGGWLRGDERSRRE